MNDVKKFMECGIPEEIAIVLDDVLKGTRAAMLHSLTPVPNRILKSGNATIVFWDDDTKTVVRCSEGETPNDYNAFTSAFAIKMYGSNTHLKKMIQAVTVEQQLKKGKE